MRRQAVFERVPREKWYRYKYAIVMNDGFVCRLMRESCIAVYIYESRGAGVAVARVHSLDGARSFVWCIGVAQYVFR